MIFPWVLYTCDLHSLDCAIQFFFSGGEWPGPTIANIVPRTTPLVCELVCNPKAKGEVLGARLHNCNRNTVILLLFSKQVTRYLGGELFVETRGTGVGLLQVSELLMSLSIAGADVKFRTPTLS